jgi:hypothetical protein
MEDYLDRLREITPHGGEAAIWTLISKTARVEAGSRILQNAEVLDYASISKKSTMSGHTKAFEYAEIRNSSLFGHARVGGCARVRDSVLEDTCEITGNSLVVDSVIQNNAFITFNAMIENSNIGCNARVLGSAKLYNVYFRSEANGDINNTICIEGEAELAFPVPMELYPGTRVHEGLWQRPPLVIHTPVFPMTEGVGDRVQIGCQNRPIEFWRKKGWDVLVKYGLDLNLYDIFIEALDNMEAFKQEFNSPENPRRKNKNEGSKLQGSRSIVT